MKNQIRVVLAAVLVNLLFGSCTKNENISEKSTLRQSLNKSALNLSKAMDAITSSRAYSILTINDGTLKSFIDTDSTYSVYIPLDTIKGVYNYQPVSMPPNGGNPLIRFFKRTADNDHMIVSLPLEKVMHPRSLRHFSPADTLLSNNFSIDVSDYHNNYNNYRDFDYNLASEISVDNVVAGNLNISSFKSPTEGIRYASEYIFADRFNVKYKFESGDTTVSSFTIMGGDTILYEEKLLKVRNDSVLFGREKEYILTIGEVQIIRKSPQHTVEVYVNGILQPNAVVTIIDVAQDSTGSICHKRDILITFEDGTSVTVSSLIGQSIGNIRILFDSLHQVFFAAYIVDWIAYDIYYQRN